MIIGGFHKIPDAILAEIQAGTYSVTPALWQRQTVFYFDDVDDTQLTVVIAPVSRTLQEGTRRSKGFNYRIGAFVLQQIHAIDHTERQAKEDALLTFVDELQDALQTLETIAVDGRSLACIPPSDDQAPFVAEAYRTAKRFVSAAEVDVYDN